MNIRPGAGAMVVMFCLVVYLPVCLTTYAFSDDYSMLIWLRQDELKLKVDFALSNGRPILIAAQGIAFRLAHDIHGLWALRALSIAGGIGFGLMLLHLLRRHGGLREGHALLLTLLMLCLPASQIMIGWASLFPYWWSAIFATLAVRVLLAIDPAGKRKAVLARLSLVALLELLALLTYQPNAMIFFALLAIVLLCQAASPEVRTADVPRATLPWRRYAAGLLAAFIAMGTAYLLIRLYPVQTARAGLETEWLVKLRYWASHSLLLAFSPFRLNPHRLLGLLHAIVGGGFQIAALRCRALRAGHVAAILLTLPLAHLPSLITQADVAPRRTLLPLSLLVMVLCYFGYVHLLLWARTLRAMKWATPRLVTGVAVVTVIAFGIAAQWHVWDRIIRAQQREFDYLKAALREQRITPGDRVYVIQTCRPGYFRRPDSLMEFGSPSNTHFWALPSMVILAAQEIWPESASELACLQVTYGYEPPAGNDPRRKVIDMNGLRQWTAPSRRPDDASAELTVGG